MYKLSCAIALSLLLLKGFSQPISRDTVSLEITETEKLFLDKNFELLAAKYEISVADAAVIQAKLYDNPSLSIDQGVYNKDNKKWFDLSKTGETAVSLQQLIYIAGKRNDRIKIQKINSQISKYQFYDLIRTLRFELRSSFYGLYFLRQSITVYNRELAALKTLVDAYTVQYQNGNVAFKELARLQALQFNLENEKIDLLKQATEKQGNLILLTGDTLARPIQPIVDVSKFDTLNISLLNYAQLLDSGFANRYDLKIADAQIQSEQANLALQKALAVPDLHLGANYDKAGSYVQHYNSLSVSFDLPFWNQNQGNIKMAKYKIDEDRVLKNKAGLEVKNDISKAYEDLLETENLYKTSINKFDSNYDHLLDGIMKGYQNHTISLLEFIDYYETYKDSKTEFYQLENNRLNAIDELNLATGTTIIK